MDVLIVGCVLAVVYAVSYALTEMVSVNAGAAVLFATGVVMMIIAYFGDR